MTRPDIQAAHQSVFAVTNYVATAEAAAKSPSHIVHRAPTKQKQKHSVSDPTVEIAARSSLGSTPAAVTEHPYVATAEAAAKSPSHTVHRAPTKQKQKHSVSDPTVEIAARSSLGSTPAAVTEHPYGPTDPKANGHLSRSTSVAVALQDITTSRFAPFGSIE